jgi:dihydroflavonol-4-reductase
VPGEEVFGSSGPRLESRAMRACVTGATGFVGGHVAAALAERGDEVRAGYRRSDRLERLAGVRCRPVRADVLDRSAMRRAVRGTDVVFHTAGYVRSRPAERVFALNALAPRVTVEAAAAEGVPRVVITSSAAALGPAANAKPVEESQLLPSDLGLTYPAAKHEGEGEALAAGARLGVEVVVVNPTYVLGVPVDRTQPGETSTRLVGNYLLGRLPAVVEGSTNVVDVRDVAQGHLIAADRGRAGERYILGGYNLAWRELVERIAGLSGIRRTFLVLPAEVKDLARAGEAIGLQGPIAAEGLDLMGREWRYSSKKARSELGFRARPLDHTLRETIAWYLDLVAAGVFDTYRPSPLSFAARGLRLGERLGLVGALRALERSTGRRLVAGNGAR